jgi:hypothetical protein
MKPLKFLKAPSGSSHWGAKQNRRYDESLENATPDSQIIKNHENVNMPMMVLRQFFDSRMR